MVQGIHRWQIRQNWLVDIKWLLAFSLVVPVATASGFQADPGNNSIRDGATIFPASTSLFVKIDNPGALVGKILEHPLRSEIESLEPVQQALNGKEMTQGKIALALFETQIGEDWLSTIRKLAGNGLFLGADLAEESVGIAFHSTDEALLKKTAGVLLGFVKQQGGENAYRVDEYRDGKFAEFDNFVVARFDDWFLVSNQKAWAKKMADNLLDGVVGGKQLKDTLAMSEIFESATAAVSHTRDAWAFLDLETIRQAGLARELFAGSTDNPAVELLFGGILEAFEDARYVATSLSFDNESLDLQSMLPFEANSFKEPREFFFGNQGLGRAPAEVELPGLLGQAVTYRDLGRWWLSKEDLFPENVIAQLAQSDSQLSTFFGGVDFGEDVLGAMQPGLRLVAKAQNYEEGVAPDIKVPSFALIGRLQNPKDERQFRVSFKDMIGLLNLTSGESNRPKFETTTTSDNDCRVTGAEYLIDEDTDTGLLIYNFSPAIAFQDDYMIISSTIDFARELAEATRELQDDTVTSASNTLLTVNAQALKHQLEINRQTLIAQSMVEGGKTRDQATGEIELALGLLDYAKDGHIDLRVEPKQMLLDVSLRFETGK